MLTILPLILLLATAGASAQTVTFKGAPGEIASFASPASISPIAVDSAGNSYVVVTNGTTNSLIKVQPSGVQTVLYSSLTFSPSAIGVNPSGTLLYFIYSGPTCDNSPYGTGFMQVARTTISGNTAANPATLPCTHFNLPNGFVGAMYGNPSDVKVDSSGNAYIPDGGLIWKIPAGSNVPTAFLECPSSVYSTGNLALSADGSTVYFTYWDLSNYYLAQVATSAFGTSFNQASITSVASGLTSDSMGLQVDSHGSVYVGGTQTSGFNTYPAVFEVSSGTLTAVTSTFPLASMTTFGVASAGNIYMSGSDAFGTLTIAGNATGAVNVGPQYIGSTSGPFPFQFSFTAGGTLGSINAFTMGATGHGGGYILRGGLNRLLGRRNDGFSQQC
jgi:sugar lactone lactonase YvrE